MADWRTAILKDVDDLPRLGVPGNIVVYGSKAASILTSTAADTVIAAGEYGSGRGVIFPQGSYIKEFSKATPAENLTQIIKNIKKWVSKGTLVSDSQMVDLNNVSDFDEGVPAGTKVLLWRDAKTRDQTFKEKVNEWVKNGGGIVYGINPWGFLSGHPERTLNDIPMDSLMLLMGVCYSTKYLSGSGAVPVDGNQANDVHLKDVIQKSKNDVSQLVAFRAIIESALTFLPDTAMADFVVDITTMIKNHTTTFHSIPTKANPVKTAEGRALASLMNRLYIREKEFDGKTIPPGTNVFPGSFTEEPTVRDETVTVKATGKPSTFYPTGMYLPAGKTLQVVLQSPTDLQNWSVVVGAHKDQLYNKVVNWRRWPDVEVNQTIRDTTTELFSPFGGLVYLKSQNNSQQEVKVTLKNIIKAPYFDITKSGAEDNWKTMRGEPGLWADIYGESMGITLPASSVRNIENPAGVMEIWDSVLAMHIDLRGMHKARGRREWVVTDEQPSAGYMHSGYPIVTHLDVADPTKAKFLLNAEILRRDGSWGLFHELGHNMQDSMWTFSGTGEVTCNIFSLHAIEGVTGVKPWEASWLKGKRSKMESYLKAGADFEAGWRTNAGVALGVYGQLARDMGWAVYKKVFREYDALSTADKPKTDDDKIDQWIVRFSKNAGKNLCPVFDFWGFPIRDSVLNAVRHLPAFLHDDETTQDMVPARAKAIRDKYGIDEESVQEVPVCDQEDEELFCTGSEEDL